MTNAIEEAREALGAFVDRPWMKCLSDDLSENHLISMDVRVADLRRASRALAALSAPAPSGLTDEGLGLAHQTPMQDVEIEYWLNQADNYAEVSIPCDDLRSLIARAISPAPSIDWKRVGETPDYDAGLLNDWGGGNVDWWQDYIRAEVGRANEYWRSIVTAMGGERWTVS